MYAVIQPSIVPIVSPTEFIKASFDCFPPGHNFIYVLINLIPKEDNDNWYEKFIQKNN